MTVGFGDLELNLTSEGYEQLDKEDEFGDKLINMCKKTVAQWKQGLKTRSSTSKQGKPHLFKLFADQMDKGLQIYLKEELKQQELSLLGALYFEKLVRKLKTFMGYISDRTNVMAEISEVTQILACENLEEMEN